MSEYGASGSSSDDLSLPKATVQKIISEILPKDIAISKEAREAITECSIEFIMMLSSQSNEIAEKEAKKTIASDHVVKALEELDFQNYLEIINKVLSEHKELLKGKEKKNNKFQSSGLSEEELLRQQEELFKKSRDRLHNTAAPSSADDVVKSEVKSEYS
ncbi:putative transcriptional repressor [Scheffersomyces coipomensis]|uniref:putative transcriptional repressor n=1 Tax=Scheffersomyces coipomensis TaxID=1788519 RepID=UPI00315DDE9F